jgi:hypothetical protein
MRHAFLGLLFVSVFSAGAASAARPRSSLPLDLPFEVIQGKQGRALLKTLSQIDFRAEPLSNRNPAATDSLSDYETAIPVSTTYVIPAAERAVLKAYLDEPKNGNLAKILGLYHFERFDFAARRSTERFRHALLASYFLNRARDLGATEPWVKQRLQRSESALRDLTRPYLPPVVEENLGSHLYFTDAFNYEESNRHQAVQELLEDFLAQPNNIVTNAYLAASNIWVGGEAPYNDATMLYSFVFSSYFAVRTVGMAEVVEAAWLDAPATHPQFRLSSILGGWVVPARRWLALLHGDGAAVSSLDAEHRDWLSINRAFHSASVGLMMFGEPQNFWEGFAAWSAGYDHCAEFPTMRSCIDRPKMSFNRLSFVLGGVDYLLKAGQVEAARQTLQVRMDPSYDFGYEDWDLGRPHWEHRENNLDAIAALYANDDPSDDPQHFLLKSHRWGPPTITCQTCHQVQGRQWSSDVIERYRLEPAHEDVAVVGSYPAIMTTWYGATPTKAP